MRVQGAKLIAEDNGRVVIHYQDILHFKITIEHTIDEDDLNDEDQRRRQWLTTSAMNDWNNFTQETVDLDVAVSIEQYCSSICNKLAELLRMEAIILIVPRETPIWYEYGNPLCNSAQPCPINRRF